MAYVVIASSVAKPGEHAKIHGHGDALPRVQDRERAFYETW